MQRMLSPREHRLISLLIQSTFAHMGPHNETRTVTFLDLTFTGRLSVDEDCDERDGLYTIGSDAWSVSCNVGYYGQTPLREPLEVALTGDADQMERDFTVLRLFVEKPRHRLEG